MERYIALMNEVMQMVGLQGWGSARPVDESNPVVHGTHANSYHHRAVCTIFQVDFTGVGQGSAKARAKKEAHKQVAHKVFCKEVQLDGPDDMVAAAMHRVFTSAKASQQLEHLLRRSAQSELDAQNDPSKRTAAPLAQDAQMFSAPAATPFAAPAMPMFATPARGAVPRPQGGIYGPGQMTALETPPPPLAYPVIPRPAPAPPRARDPRLATTTATTRLLDHPFSAFTPHAAPFASSSLSAAAPQVSTPAASTQDGTRGVSAPYIPLSTTKTPSRHVKAAPRALPPRSRPVYVAPPLEPLPTPIAYMEACLRPRELVRSPHQMLLCSLLRALGDRWSPGLRVAFQYRNQVDSTPMAVDFGDPAMATLAFSDRSRIRATWRPAQPATRRAQRIVLLPLSLHVFDDLLHQEWRLCMPDATSQIATSFLRANLRKPTVDLGPRLEQDRHLIFSLEHYGEGVASRLWAALINMLRKLPGYVSDGRNPSTHRSPHVRIPAPPHAAKDFEAEEKKAPQQARLDALRRSEMNRFPEAAQALYRSCLKTVPSRVAKAGPRAIDPRAVASVHKRVARLRSGAGRIFFREVLLEAGNADLTAVGVDAVQLGFRRPHCSSLESAVEWTSLVTEVCRTLDYFLALGTFQDLDAFRQLFAADFTSATSAPARPPWDDNSLGPQSAAVPARAHVMRAQLGDLWAARGVFERLCDVLQLHSLCEGALSGLAADIPFYFPDMPADGRPLEPLQEVPPVLHELLRRDDGLGAALNEGWGLTLRCRLQKQVCEAPALLDLEHLEDRAMREAFGSAAAKAKRLILALIEARLLPGGRVAVHHCLASPVAYIHRRGVHHVNLQDNWFFAFLACLPPRLAPAARLLQVAIIKACREANQDDAEGSAGDAWERRALLSDARGGPGPAAPSLFREAVEAPLRCLMVCLIFSEEGDVFVDASHADTGVYTIRSAGSAVAVASLEVDAIQTSIFIAADKDPWSPAHGGDFLTLAVATLFCQGMLEDLYGYHAESRVRDCAKRRLQPAQDGALQWTSSEALVLKPPLTPLPFDLADGTADAAEDREGDDGADEAEALPQDEASGGRSMLSEEELEASTLFRLFAEERGQRKPGEPAARRHVVRLVFRNLGPVGDALKRLCATEGSGCSFLCTRDGLPSTMSLQRSGSATLLLDDALCQRVYFRGFLVADDGFPWAGLNFTSPRPQPPAFLHEGGILRSVLDARSVEDVWDDMLDQKRFDARKFAETLSTRHCRDEKDTPWRTIDESASALLLFDLGPALSKLRLRVKLVNELQQAIPDTLVPVCDEAEKWLWSQVPREGRVWLVHPLVRELLACRGHALYARLADGLMSSPVVDPLHVLSEVDLEMLRWSMDLLGLLDRDDELVFHDAAASALVYARVGRLHHMGNTLSGRELLTQMLLGVSDANQIRVLVALQEGLAKPTVAAVRHAGFLAHDALEFLLQLRTGDALSHGTLAHRSQRRSESHAGQKRPRDCE